MVQQLRRTRRPRVAVTFGDPAGIGPELIAKVLSNRENLEKADIFVLGDRSELESAIQAAGGIEVPIADKAGQHGVQILDDGTAPSRESVLSEVSKEGGERCLHQLRRGLDLAKAGDIDAIVFAPLNKTSLHLAGMTEEDELRWFAKQLDYAGTTSEINIAGALWTARVTSHVGLEKVAGMINKESTLKAIELLHQLRWESGIESPRLGVCALNPHNGENGNFGRQEIDSIAPAVQAARAKGINVEGPFPCDTIFLKRDKYDGIVTMYHDQGQIALKLLSFVGGVTVQGGLPVVISTPAHGTAFDIVGKNLASPVSTQCAFDVAVQMATRRLEKQLLPESVGYAECLQTGKASLGKVLPHTTTTEVPSCC
ncbi:4-hydroxythreonine-4-phosphate dehydrogenase [Exophiala viscosa]|uniref:4-hydroxythreonine-4-phosphate dehydrogenase n=1 Tax=Exophiala viscosa TaxID=2486360 RepID=A0AAN6E0G6_9EURO|nr:4-hydroxythreonine-4-phosphate dehydrogenase [Exophiala viscosa]KAI1621601.1 4-hydroxythreonine-4-phosphate dehydrogenase [Exophiala viscosa]